ncbi:low molecular weight protein-tyrosine-phosphatase [Corynebacterium anserum]|uniref:protein-tyrosine-phosphatase n=1 Tax=Corynebacterium anserum TaxID=2684406 RepID=A0A7G7YMS2_9CORY|nr:low molecular weight protein-tyrosine-phosphatase [Corynebacterium anserum]MBC2681169.1 low molecular weight phosphotyrosine protein phosphatase [Corynebacterium anserum]QNH95792.1 low molecular weight phosphotyrosine protein phosphatase [Corynebacterium anserum]
MSKISQITVVCTGNICRSPMGDVMLNKALKEQGIPDVVVNSCGLGGWHVGDSADPRAVRELQSCGYDGTRHVAAQIGDDHLEADAFLAMDRGHVRGLSRLGVDPAKIYLFRAFDPAVFDAAADSAGFHSLRAPEVADPYYDDAAAFTTVARQIEAAVPGIITNLVLSGNEDDTRRGTLP